MTREYFLKVLCFVLIITICFKHKMGDRGRRLVQLAHAYITNGVTRSAKVPKSMQCAKCSFKCTEKFSFEERNDLCRYYYSLDFICKKNVILSCLKIQPVKTRKLQKTSNKKYRMTSKNIF